MTRTRLSRQDYVPPRNDDSGSHATKPRVGGNDIEYALTYPRNKKYCSTLN
ncbi:hypothetical protein [Rickettsia endosymbiont of Aspidapion aeneum]|uniref:hypothetical protein n=1 Tax=Rickettsia endosymbiont of Aspidapion aeneum TaxID=3066247 RepID=UPI00313B6529